MKTYAIFNRKFDCEIWVNLKVGTLESMDTAREMIFMDLEANPSLEAGYVESYPFFQAEWQAVGGRMDKDFDFNQILEVENDYGTFEEKKQFECFWGDGYRATDNKSTLKWQNENFFTEENGYEKRWVDHIHSLDVDEVFNLDCAMTGEHWVRRIK